MQVSVPASNMLIRKTERCENRAACAVISLADEVFIEMCLSQFPCFPAGLSFFVWHVSLDGYLLPGSSVSLCLFSAQQGLLGSV